MTPAARDRLAGLGLGLAPLGVVLLTAWITVRVLVDGAGQVDRAFLTDLPVQAGRAGGIASILAGTAWVLLLGVGVALPIGLGAAIHLAEFSRRRGRTLRLAIDVLAALPSIVYGLFGLAFFCEALGLGWSVLSGGLTVAMMIVPLFTSLGEAALTAVPDALREAGAALGVPRWRLVWRVLLPEAAPALAAALVLASGRVLAESAVFLYTAGTSMRMPAGPLDPARTLAVHVYLLAVEVPGGGARAAAASVVLLGAVLLTSTVAAVLPRLLLARRSA